MAKKVGQLEFELRERASWGGRRAGAGRTCGPSPRHDHRARAPLAARFPCHVTLKVRRGLPSLRSVRLVRELERSFAIACERGRFRLVHYSIQNDHLHAIVEAMSARDLACGMKSLGSRLARAVNRAFGRRGSVLADRYHLHVLRTPAEVRHALAYVLLNARRHLAKLGRTLPRIVQLDPASSGRFFFGWNRRFQPASSLHPPPVSSPHTWLLSIGWRRYGLIDPTEIPGPRGA
jgi:REP element-mobilizing transposase RayT